MRLQVLALTLAFAGCIDLGAPGENPAPGPCDPFGDLPEMVAPGDMPLKGFLLVDGYLCYAPLGTIRQETCTKYELHLLCTPKDYTYCPSVNATVSIGVDPLEVHARLYCGADRLPSFQ